EHDPGELFFRRQEKEILQKLTQASPKKKFSFPLRVFAAAAMILLVIGAGKILHDQNQPKFSQVDGPSIHQAELSPKLEFVDIDDLDTQQLDRLANRLSQKVWQGVREEWVEPSSDWEDLNSEEMKNLIEKLEDRLKT
ncbi:MAG: hypothetical protein H7A32_03010, partial [Deltaproteobacteria bacterium]|nr:hypothetical protein [Deltaproteobacteria bacterium]